MKMVIIGAGASYDSIYRYFEGADTSFRPPLGNEILDPRPAFREILRSYPGAQAYMAQVNALNDVETFFQQQWEMLKNHRSDETLAAFINLQYCLQDLFIKISNNYANQGLNNYDVLVKWAHDFSTKTNEEVLFVSFNYDLFIEKAFRKIYWDDKMFQMSEYCSYPLKLIKPHGSCNWVKEFKEKGTPFQMVQHRLFKTKANLFEINNNLKDEILINERNGQFHKPVKSEPYGDEEKTIEYFPQILIPMKDKDEFILPPDQKKYLNNNLRKIDDILIIGWKGNEFEFQELLKNKLDQKKINITYVCAGDQEIENHMKRCIPQNNSKHFRNSYEPITDSIALGISKRPKGNLNLQHIAGSFSSYVLNVSEGIYPNFFST
jgi:hypothetical protein